MQRIGFILAPDFQLMATAVMSVFEFANLAAPEPVYDVRVLSEAGGLVRSSLGLSVQTERLRASGLDTLIVGGGVGASTRAPSPGTTRFVRKAAQSVRRVASVCTGAFVLAEAGVLDGRRVTTHWMTARLLQQRFPATQVEEDRIYIADGPIWTSAGMSAGIDLALGMVEQDLGADVARTVAQRLVLHHRRGNGQSQHATPPTLSPTSERIQTALAYAQRNLRAPLTVDELAAAAHLSPRQFSRAFTAETGQSPAKAVEQLRLQAARVLVEQGQGALDAVAADTGFADPERMRRAFVRAFGQPPQALRRAARLNNDNTPATASHAH